ncbi:hypothetical protein GCM10022254_09680 [Actinomadura meridiana]|uniref:Uncharacterized protein n=1 Tax=Actinomadura meridiana TaxID=559626 RepID=A0ABP8BTR0_9ACTN
MPTIPAPGDVQVATGFPEVNTYRAARDRVPDLNAAIRRAARYQEWVMDNYLTTTPAGREGRASAQARLDQARGALAAHMDELPALGEAAKQTQLAATARAEQALKTRMGYRAAARAWYRDQL